MNLRPGETGAGHFLGPNLVAGEVQIGELAPQHVDVQTCIHQRPEHHVAARPAEAVEIGDAAHGSSPSRTSPTRKSEPVTSVGVPGACHAMSSAAAAEPAVTSGNDGATRRTTC